MSHGGPTLVMFHGPSGQGEAEQMVARAKLETAHRQLTLVPDHGIEAALVVTAEPEAFASRDGHVTLDVDVPGERFDFGKRLADVIEHHAVHTPIVMGTGALPLLMGDGFEQVVAAIAEGAPAWVTNNFYSGDLTGWTPGAAASLLKGVTRDNALPRRLRDDAGLEGTVLPRTTATTFDLDTPADVAVLAVRRNETVPGTELLTEGLEAVMSVLTDRDREVVVAGRVGSAAWQYLERETACRVRMLSEERGMAAAGEGHRARSALGYLYEEVGAAGFFERMAELGDVLVLDRRVLEAHLGIEGSREDRFQADLLAPSKIEDGRLREFVEAAVESRVPVVMGGHSLVSGGLMVLNDVAWERVDREAGR